MIRNSLAGDVESGAMIDGRSNDRQPKSDVHRPAEREALYRDQTLVVVTGCDGVELSFERAQKESVGWEGPAHSNVFAAALFDCGLDLASLPRAKQAVLACVRVESGYGDPRSGDPKPLEFAISQLDCSCDPLCSDCLNCIGEAAMN